jgi:hypothetical protein
MVRDKSIQFTVAKAAEILKVDKQLIKKWAYHFANYLSKEANPAKGITRLFSVDDIRVFAYVSYYWEDEPDFECINIGLNREEHHEYPYNELITILRPIFREVPDNIEEKTSSDVLIMGLSEEADLFYLANSYKVAGDALIESAIENDNAYELIYPIIYNYRHAIELYLKDAIINRKKKHNLITPLQELKDILKRDFNAEIPEWFRNVIVSFSEYDPEGKAFRYGLKLPQYETYVDLHHLRDIMGQFGKAFQTIRNGRRLPS